MSHIVTPDKRIPTMKVKGLIYGQPGCGKSTLALSSPNPVMVDADLGMTRVERRYQAPSIPLESYAQLLDTFNQGDFDPFETIVFDTGGKLVDRIGEYVMEDNPKARLYNGSLSMSGWGDVKKEFSNLLSRLHNGGKHVIFIAHEREESHGDERVSRPDIAGSSGKELLKELDFMGYMEIIGDRRTICLSPSEKFYAKNSIGLNSRLDIPVLGKESRNNFIQKEIIERTKQSKESEDVDSVAYDKVMKDNKAVINSLETPEDFEAYLDKLKNEVQHVWYSKSELKLYLYEKSTEKGIYYDKEAHKFCWKEAKKPKKASKASAPKTGEAKQDGPEAPEQTGPDEGDQFSADEG